MAEESCRLTKGEILRVAQDDIAGTFSGATPEKTRDKTAANKQIKLNFIKFLRGRQLRSFSLEKAGDSVPEMAAVAAVKKKRPLLQTAYPGISP
ncbi:MAG: hypothetical protein ACYC5N_01225 [Endomicrobiales bacterium]